MNSPERVDLIYALVRLSDLLKRVAADALSDRLAEDKWFGLAELLAEAARQCRQQTPVGARLAVQAVSRVGDMDHAAGREHR